MKIPSFSWKTSIQSRNKKREHHGNHPRSVAHQECGSNSHRWRQREAEAWKSDPKFLDDFPLFHQPVNNIKEFLIMVFVQAMSNVEVLENHSMLVDGNGRISGFFASGIATDDLERSLRATDGVARVIDASGKCLLPGFVDGTPLSSKTPALV